MPRWNIVLLVVAAALCVASVATDPPLTAWFGWPGVALAVMSFAVLLAPLVAVPCRARSRRSGPR